MRNFWGCSEIVFLVSLNFFMKGSAQFSMKHTWVCVLDFGWSFSSRFIPSQTLDFSLYFTGEFALVLNAGLDTKGYTNGTGCSPASALATVSSYLHNKSIFISTHRFYSFSFRAVQKNTKKIRHRVSAPQQHWAKKKSRVSFLVISFVFKRTALVWLKSVM